MKEIGEIINRHFVKYVSQIAGDLRIGMKSGTGFRCTGFVHAIEVYLNGSSYLFFVAHVNDPLLRCVIFSNAINPELSGVTLCIIFQMRI